MSLYVLWPLHFLKKISGQLFWKMSLNLGFPDVFSCLNLGYGLLTRIPQKWCFVLELQIKRQVMRIFVLLLVVLTLITCLMWYLPSFYKVTIFPFQLKVSCGKILGDYRKMFHFSSNIHPPVLASIGVFLPEKIIIMAETKWLFSNSIIPFTFIRWHFILRKSYSFPFIHSFTHPSIHGLLFSTTSYNQFPSLFILISNCPDLDSGNSFTLTPISFWYPSPPFIVWACLYVGAQGSVCFVLCLIHFWNHPFFQGFLSFLRSRCFKTNI